MRHHDSMLRQFAAVAVASLFAAACTQSEPTSPSSASADLFGGTVSSVLGNAHGVEVCKFGPEGTTATFEWSMVGGGNSFAPETFTLDALPQTSGCIDGINRRVIWVAADPNTGLNTVVTVTEVGATAGISLERLVISGGLEGGQDLYPPMMGGSATVNFDLGANFVFKNIGTPQTEGSAGCTPGYWKQSQHFDSWTSPYTPSTMFSDVFADAFPGKTLLDVLKQGGGGLKALGRHTVAALLNTANEDVDYGMSTAEVIALFNAEYNGSAVEATKDLLAGRNERGCSIN